MRGTLAERRYAAAEASKGSSTHNLYRAVLEIVEELSLSGTCIDFGSGVGKFIRVLQRTGRFSRITGADIVAKPDLPVEWIEADLNEERAVNGAFDVVFSLVTIEHLENPRGVMRQLYRILRPGGCAIVTTPNSENLRGYLTLLTKRHFWAFTETNYPAHITTLLEADLRRCGAEAGFERITFDYRSPGGVPKFPRLKWQRLGLSGRLFCDNVIMVAFRPLAE